MRLLFLTNRLLSSEDSGWTRRLYPFLKELKAKGHYVCVISFYDNDSELINLEYECEYYNKVIPVKLNRKISILRMFRSFFTKKPFKLEFDNTLKMKKAIEKELKTNVYDIIYSHFYKMASYLKYFPKYKRVVDLCDANIITSSRLEEQATNVIDKFFINLEKDFIYKFEKSCMIDYDKVFFISEIDKQAMMSKEIKKEPVVIKNGVDTNFYFNKESFNYNKNKIVYVGTMSSLGNHDAVMYFLKSIYPKIKKEIPKVEFTIIGANPRQELLDFVKSDNSVTVTGRVDDVREYLKLAGCSVAPMRGVAGLQNKILETMSMGIPTVTTTNGAEGIASNENCLFIEDDEEKFAQKVIKLLSNSELRNQYSIKARKYCVDNFSWKACGDLLEKELESLLK